MWFLGRRSRRASLRVTRASLLLCLAALLLGPASLHSALAAEATIGRIAVTSVAESSFAVSWVTDQPADGYVLYGTDQNRPDAWTRVDDVRGPGYQGYTHYVSVENGDPGAVAHSTKYYFSVTSTQTTVSVSGPSPLSVTTGAAPLGQAPEPNFFSGIVRYSNASPAAGVLVFVTLQRPVVGMAPVTSQRLSGLTDISGTFSIDVSRARHDSSGTLGDYFRLSTTSADEKVIWELDAGTGSRVTGTVDGNATSAGSAAPVQPRMITLPMAPPALLPTPSPTSALVLTPPPPLEQTVTPATATPRPSPSPTATLQATATQVPPTPAAGTPSPAAPTSTATPTPLATVAAGATPAATPTVVAVAAADQPRVPPSILAVIVAAVLLITTGLALTGIGLIENSRRR